jgi:hypothetical protein
MMLELLVNVLRIAYLCNKTPRPSLDLATGYSLCRPEKRLEELQEGSVRAKDIVIGGM